MAERHGADPSFGLRRFARIIDDEWIDDRQRADQRFRPAVLGERNGLAGQPLERAVGADVDQCIRGT